MNAYELADEIEDSYCEGKKLTDVANILRQQAQQIETLTDRLNWYRAKEMLTENNHLGVIGVKPYGEF